MKSARRLISGMLSLVMALSLLAAGLPAASAAQASGADLTGSIGLTLRFDLPQTAEDAARREICLQVAGGDGETVVPLPEGAAEQNTLNAGVSVEVENADGAPLTNEACVGYYRVELTGLPAGQTYQVRLTGTGYVPFETSVTLDGYSKHLIVGTGDGTFPLGDVNGDGRIDIRDLDAMDVQLGKKLDTDGRRALDLNGDGSLDVADLAYISHNQGLTGTHRELDTAAIAAPAVDEAALNVTGGNVADLFREEGEVTLSPAAGGGAISLPISFASPVEMSEIRIVCPDGDGAVQKAEAAVELEDGSTVTAAVDAAPPAGVHAIGRTEGRRVVTIDLGNKVAVKKVTITVTPAGGGYATVRKVEFLKDIVPDSPKNDQPQILSAVPGDGQVALEWTAVHNITGYVIDYWLDGKPVGQLPASSTRAVVTGLKNLETYQFQVTAVNGDWKGAPSAAVSATPEPGQVPGAPSNIRVTEADQSLRLSWGSTKDAVYYRVFYREAGRGSFTQFGGNVVGTSAAITGLTNGKTYEVAVKAGNGKGLGPYSATAEGTPKREELSMPELPTDGRIENSHVIDVKMTNPNNVDRGLCPNFTPKQVVDGDAATYWIARAFWESREFTFTFDQPQDMNYVIWVPYLQGNYKYMMARYSITAMDEEGNVISSGTYGAPSMTDKNYLVLTFPLSKGVKKLSVSLAQVEGRSSVNIAEMAFYQSDGLADEIAGLFANGSFTALKEGVTGDQIAALAQRLKDKAGFYLDVDRLQDELALAQALLDKEDALGVVKNDFQSRSAGMDKAFGQSASSLQPLGVSAKAGATVAVYAELPSDAPVKVAFTQFYGESGVWHGGEVELVNGRNYISVPKIGSLKDERGGPLYLTYAGAHPEQIKLQVRGDGAAVFAMPVLELSGWYGMDEAARMDAIRAYVAGLESYVGALNSADLTIDVRNATEISTPSVLLSIPASQALSGLKGGGRTAEEMAQAMYQNVLAWEDVLFVANKVQGIIPGDLAPEDYEYPMATRQNIRYMRMFAGAFMYAAGNHVGVGYGSTTGLVCGRPASATGVGNANGLFGWGIAHEIGHNMDKLGRAEITNNIYSLAIQAYDGGSMCRPTRLTNSNIWKGVFDKTSVGRPGSAGNVFVQLAMYWQLHLAYDTGEQPLAFFNRFFTYWKAGEYGSYKGDERIALVAAKTAGKDLTQFFTRWGVKLSAEAKKELARYGEEPRAIWYLNDDAYAARLAGEKAFAGTVTVSAAVTDNKAALTIEGGDESILGYEIRRNGKAIAFTTEPSYEDDLGPANNLTYTYSVIPVDKLGNQGGEAKAKAVRVAWDKPIEAEYTEAWKDGVLTITMKNGAAQITGVKITGAELGGNYKVEVQARAGGAWATAKVGTLSGSTVVDYFTKPGAKPDDARIWTYDAEVLRITGLPAGAKVTLLDYPGDRVDFYSGAVAGRLWDDYRYGDKADEVIPAGTLVVLGTYRGDPAFNTVEVKARFSTADEGAETAEGDAAVKERTMSGYALLFAEVPEGGRVSDTSDGFWLFVPNQAQEDELNEKDGVTGGPMEIQAVFYRYDGIDHSGTPRLTSDTLWVSFPGMEELPEIVLTGAGAE